MIKILIVEDDKDINEMLCELLRQNGYEPVSAYSGTEAALLLCHGTYSLILLDLMLPGKSGEEVLSELRGMTDIPVIVQSARADKESTISLLRMGADDYITKPFDTGEVLARIEVQLRRGSAANTDKKQLKYKEIVLDLEGYDALINKQKAGLSKREYEILHLLMSHPNKVYTKNNLYESVWGGEFLGDDNTVNVHISKLRAKLHALSPDREYIKTVWGIGFKMKD